MKTKTQQHETTFTLITQVSDLWQESVNEELKKNGLTNNEFNILNSLIWLKNESAHVTQVNICEYINVKPMNTSIIMHKLQTKKLIQRKEHPVDTRAKTISLTPIGEKKIADVVQAVEALTVSFFKIEPSKIAEFNKRILEIRNNKKK
ncbi:MAG: MarR family winged helix-turn-helix transcriptional regulator [Bacteroidia bacterium]